MSVFKEVNYFMKNIDAISNGQVKLVRFNEADDFQEDSESDSDDMMSIIIEIKPNASLYKGGRYIFKLFLSNEFPNESPRLVRCLSPIDHPNIDMDITYETNVCLNILDSEQWHSSIGLTGCVLGLLYLLYNPQLDDPLNSNFTPGMSTEEFENRVKKSVTEKNCIPDEFNTDIGICNENNQKLIKHSNRQNEIDSLEQDMDTSDLSDVIQLVELILQNNDIGDTDCEQNCDMQVCEDDAPNPRGNTLEVIPYMPKASVPDVTAPNISSPVIPAMPHELTDASNSSPINPDMPYEFNGYKLTKHGTTFLPNIDYLQTPSLSVLIKRFTV